MVGLKLTFPTITLADGPDSKSGVQPQVISLPTGPGSIEGIGESFEPDLSTGTAHYPVNFTVPPGVAGFQPTLTLSYNGGNGNGPWGLGWKLNLPHLQRQTDEGLPQYDDALDRFIYSNGEKLVRLDNGDYRFENEGQFIRFRRLADGGWEAHQPDGVRYIFGQTAEARVVNDYGIFRWQLEQQIDPNGNEIRYLYSQDRGYAYLNEIRYNFSVDGRYNAVIFRYESRPDIFTDRTSRAPITLGQRVTEIEMQALGELVRLYRFGYMSERSTGSHSLLETIIQVGADGSSTLPPFTFDYTMFDPAAYTTISMQNPPPLTLRNGDVELVDISYDGLPDVIHTTNNGHRYYLNQGQGQWQPTVVLPDQSPPDQLSSPSVRLADMDSNGQTDLLVKAGSTPGSPFYYYAGRPTQPWEQSDRIDYNLTPTFDLDDPNLRLVDMNNDKRIDILLTTNNFYFIWLARKDNTWPTTADATVPSLAVGTPLLFENPQVKLGDMTGDRLQDMVYIRDGLVVYFPHNGLGDYDEGVSMTGAPTGLGALAEQIQLTDINGDGLDDLVLAQNSSVRYWLNRGNDSLTEAIILDGTPTYNQADTAVRLADMDGDGASDLLFSRYPAPEDMVMQYVDFFTGTKPLLLNRIENGLGRTINIDYRPNTDFYVADWTDDDAWATTLPFPVQVVSRMTVQDANSGDTYVTDYRYRDGYYDGIQKEFRGFAQVIRTQYGDDTAATTVTAHHYDTGAQEESRKGLLLEETILGAEGQCETPFNECYRRQVNQPTTRVLYDEGQDQQVTYSFITQRDTYLYENQASPVQLQQTFDRDSYGNLIQHFNYGQVCDNDRTCGDDEVLTYTQYAFNEGAWIINKPALIKRTDDEGQFVSEVRRYYDGDAFVGFPLLQVAKGNLSRQEEGLGPLGDNRFIPTQRNKFDSRGNIVEMLDGEGHLTTIEYDPLVFTFPVVESLDMGDGHALTFAASYHYGFGKVAGATDFNGNPSAFVYDTFGRLEKIVLPGDSFEQPSQRFEYVMGSPRSQIITEQREVSGTDQILRSVAYFDGLGRKLQTRREAEAGQVIIEAATTFNARKTQKEQYQPYFDSSFDYSEPSLAQPHTTQHYDPLGRVIRTDNEDGSYTKLSYRPLQTIEYDEEDTRTGGPYENTPKTLSYDGLQRLITVREINRFMGQEETYTTTYQYDLLGNLTHITDAQGNLKRMQFDGLSRKLLMNDPNKGEMVYQYDDNGNLIETRDAKGQVIRYQYDPANRVEREQWLLADNTLKDHVIYHYDTDLWPLHPDATNTMGQVTYIEDEAGAVYFSYDARGNVTGQIRHFTEEGLEFTTRMAYDALDRLTDLTYPDGTTITYEYNDQGLLAQIPGFVDDLSYFATDQREKISYANGVSSDYDYDIRLRLERLLTTRSGSSLQDLTYTFDDAGNIVSIADNRPDRTPENDQTQSYEYDALYRLTQAGGTYGQIDFRYDSVGNMTSKTSTVTDPRLNLGEMRYGENGAGPYALTSTAQGSREYDNNGNLVTKDEALHTWDYRDRLTSVTDGQQHSTYSYDADGQRTRQLVRQGEVVSKTLYLGQYAEIRGGELIKYIFDDTQRIARVATPFTPGQLISGFTEKIAPKPPSPSEIRWYLTDHLGGTSLLLNDTGQIVSEVVYYPYGLTRYEKNGDEVRYHFTGKELDATGLHYYGARYYDAAVGRFISVDPLYAEQPDRNLSAPQSLNTYAYALNNPMKYIDPSGLESVASSTATPVQSIDVAGMTGVDGQSVSVPIEPSGSNGSVGMTSPDAPQSVSVPAGAESPTNFGETMASQVQQGSPETTNTQGANQNSSYTSDALSGLADWVSAPNDGTTIGAMKATGRAVAVSLGLSAVVTAGSAVMLLTLDKAAGSAVGLTLGKVFAADQFINDPKSILPISPPEGVLIPDTSVNK